ncbi:MAG: VOC family protein [Chloroflexota bacterium]|nr:VOC family protein [Chloroflexota bacterium]
MSHHAIVHLELSASDLDETKEFYHELFGWKVKPVKGADYEVFQPSRGPGGAFIQVGSAGMKPGEIRVYIESDDVAANLEKVEELGGKVIIPETIVPGVGIIGVFTDPTGNKLTLIHFQLDPENQGPVF